MSNLLEQTIASAQKGLEDRKFSSVELAEAYLAQVRGMDGVLHAYLTVCDEQALESAKKSDERRASGKAVSVVDGVPIAIKDNILLRGVRATGGSKILENYVAPYDGTAVKKMKDAGAVILGKTNMDEFAMGSSTEHSAFGSTRHLRDYERVPGGSSGGSACAVAADLCVAALGSDTGGSIRQPASLCGIVGFKPTYGRVSRYGLMSMASSLDQIGPMTKTVEDSALLFDILSGHDVHDQTTIAVQEFMWNKRKDLKGVRIGLPRQAWTDDMNSDVHRSVSAGVEILRSLGAEIVEVDLPYSDEALAVYYILMPCEVSSNLARFDGMRYGMREDAKTLIETYAETRANGFGKEVRRRVLLGTYALSKGYYDAYYRKARKVQTLIKRAYTKVFDDVDILVTPTSPSTAFKIGAKSADPLSMYLEDIYTVGANVAGLPAISVPCGDHEGLPIGLQMIGRRMGDGDVLSTAYAFEQARL